MNIAIYHPNLNHFGGGETVALTIASALSKAHKVDIITHTEADKSRLSSFFGLDLSNVNIIVFKPVISSLPFPNTIMPFVLLKATYSLLEKYDVAFDTCTNGWFDKKLKCKTICYIHFPFFYPKKKGLKSILNPYMIFPENAFQYDKILCNSNFTKSIVSKMTGKEITVVYPPVEVENIKPAKKKLSRIVTIGRFTYEKKHEVMIDAFKELSKTAKNYSFHLIGSFQENNDLYKKDYFDMLKKRADGYPIEFHINMPHEQVLRFLEESKIYWHARGYGETNPNEYENFGITTVEAMAALCVPIVINLGAQPEIVEHGKSGYVWSDTKELVKYTSLILKNKVDSLDIIKKSKKYSKYKFLEKIEILIS
ncbi:MAG: glycosyltransferase family 4 protein [archaeon]